MILVRLSVSLYCLVFIHYSDKHPKASLLELIDDHIQKTRVLNYRLFDNQAYHSHRGKQTEKHPRWSL